ncbi:MAG TPA: di-heme oxidoredictase family protein [Terriglobia bacterium]|nr:di-heme oxidoredictase family protein [Terriglobia bacterium]
MVERQNRWKQLVVGRTLRLVTLAGGACLIVALTAVLWAQATVSDPGVRGINWCTGCANTVGTFQSTLTTQEQESEAPATTQFETSAVVTCNTDGSNVTGCGLGPRFNGNSCSSCHAQPVAGGSSPSGLPSGPGLCNGASCTNPLFQVYQGDGTDAFSNTMPSFETLYGPVLIPRFPYQSDLKTPDGTVHQLFTIAGTSYSGCTIAQPNFTQAQQQNNLVFRQPLPLFGDGYIDFIQNKDILNNLNANLSLKASLGIGGVPSMSGSDGSVQRMGWKAQWRAVLPATLAEEKVEEGISNELLPTEIDQTPGCVINAVPEDPTNYSYLYGDPGSTGKTGMHPWFFLADAERDAIFERFLERPETATQLLGAAGCPGGVQKSCTNGQTDFNNVGCVLCHTTSFTTPPASIPSQGHIVLNLFSDLVLHHMGSCLADNITEGAAAGDMWRTAPLWDVGQRIAFMHDGRTTNILTAIEEHADGWQKGHGGGCTGVGTYQNSEADAVIKNFNNLTVSQQQDLINFLRSL